MAQINHVTVPAGIAANAWGGRGAGAGVATILFINQDLNNYVYLGLASNITPGGTGTIPVAPNGTFSGSADTPWWVTGSVAGIQPLVVIPGGSGYFLGLTQGYGDLVIPSVQSPNFVPGISGWQISKNGDAEFNSVIVRGNFNGTDFTITDSGCFFYAGAPGYGGLAQSIVPGAVSVLDPEGNAALPGFTTYEQKSGVWYANNMLAGQIAIWTAVSAAGPYAQSAAGLFFLTGGNTFINAVSGQKIELSAPVIADYDVEITGQLNADSAVNISGPATLVNESVTPAATANAILFSDRSGSLHVVDGTDGNTYATQAMRLVLFADTPTLVTLTTVWSFNGGPRTYVIRGKLFASVPVANAQLASQISAPTGVTGNMGVEIKRATTWFGGVSGSIGTVNAITVNLPAATGYLIDFEAVIHLTVTGLVEVKFGSATTPGIIISAWSSLDIMPT